ncbi:hypothetical protein [Paenibacillus elgii]|uniref:hypothetical protein n=1 Tax=Paenibacillus elgii TaxID=189691 RepID=UPI000248D52D
MSLLQCCMYLLGIMAAVKVQFEILIVDRLGISINIDPDSLAGSFDADQPDRRKVSAGKEAIKLARDCIRHNRDFSIETTLAGRNVIRLMRDAKANGFEVTMFYVGLGD